MTQDFNRVVFVHVPKTAGTALRAALNAKRGKDSCSTTARGRAPRTEEVREYLAVEIGPAFAPLWPSASASWSSGT